MAVKRSGSKVSKKLESFNRSQAIHNALEKGIIESEALLNSAADRPDDDAHIGDLLASTAGESGMNLTSKPSRSRPKASKKSAAKSKPSPKRRKR